MMIDLSIDGVSKLYDRDHWALREVTLRLGGGVLGLVGPNGAGKSTLLRMLATVLAPSKGHITWDGQDVVRRPVALRRALGYLPQDFGAYPQLTAREFLRYTGELKCLEGQRLQRRVESVLEAVNLRADGNRRLRGFSGGMIRRLGIAQALLNEPRLLVLDEPTAGLDPSERIRFRELIATLGGERQVVLSTHIISDVEAMATDLVLLQAGRVAWAGSPEGLLADAEGQVWSMTVEAEEFERLRARHRVSAAVRRADGVQVRLIATTQPHPQAVPIAPTLEDAYLIYAA
jgi:ABC-type multidrug transport system ATPase subunit